jgi:hypothetical protein
MLFATITYEHVSVTYCDGRPVLGQDKMRSLKLTYMEN